MSDQSTDDVPREGDELLVFWPIFPPQLEGRITKATVVIRGDKFHASYMGDDGVEFERYGDTARSGGLGEAFVYKTTNLAKLRDKLGARIVEVNNSQVALEPNERAAGLVEYRQRLGELKELLTICNKVENGLPFSS